MRGNVPESLANRLGPLKMETGATAPVAPSSDMRTRLGTAPPPRTQPLESRLGRSVEQSRISSQTVSRSSDTSATATPASTTRQSPSAVPTEGVKPNSVLLWNRPDPSSWGPYKTDMSAKLNMNTLTCREDDRWRGSHSVTIVSSTGCGLADSGTGTVQLRDTLRYVDLHGLPQGNTLGPLNNRSLKDVSRRAIDRKQHLLGRESFWQRISTTKSITRCTDSLLNLPANCLVNTRETMPERPRWKETTGDMQG